MADPIPVAGVLVREGEMTGDGRTFAAGAIKWGADVLPIPIIFDREEGDHSGATVGYIDTVWREGQDIRGQGYLSASDDPHTQALVSRASELLNEGAVGVSVGVDKPVGDVAIDLALWDEAKEEDGKLTIPMRYDAVAPTFRDARLRHLAIVDTAAFSTAGLSLVTEHTGALVAAGAMSQAHLFADPEFGVPGTDSRLKYDPASGKWSCPPTLKGDHYFGHVAPDGICLRGQPGRCITPPDANLEAFMRHYAPAAGGLRTGTVQIAGSHGDLGTGVMAAQRHYDNTGKAVADVRVGRDAYGVWFSGMIRPGTNDNDRYALAASDVSGHWEQEQNGRMALVGLPAVNVGGYPKGYLSAAEVASGIAASGSVTSLVETDQEWQERLYEAFTADISDNVEHDACGCHGEEPGIDLATVLKFVDRRNG